MQVYVDESGDLGFTKNSTKFFIVAYLECESSQRIQVELKRTLKHLHTRKQYALDKNELKFSRMDDQCRKAVLKKISECELSLGVVVLEKAMVKANLRKEPTILYNWCVVHNVVLSLVSHIVANRKVHIVFDKGLPTWKIEEFNSYVKNKARYLLNEQGTKLGSDFISVKHLSSEIEPCLQGADAIAGAYFQKYENGNSEFVRIIEEKVEAFTYLWRKQSEPRPLS